MDGKYLLIALALVQLFCLAGRAVAITDYELQSPNNRIRLNIRTGDRIEYDVFLNGRMLLKNCRLSIDIDHRTLGVEPKVKSVKRSAIDREIAPTVPQKFAKLRENYNELKLEMDGGYAVLFRVYSEGVAYRLETALPEPEVKIYGEEVLLNFAGDYNVYYPQEESFFSHNEREFHYLRVKDISKSSIASLPAVIDTKEGAKIAVCESDIEDYPGLWFEATVTTASWQSFLLTP